MKFYFKLCLSLILTLLTVSMMIFFRGSIVKNYWEVAVEATGTKVYISSNITSEKFSKKIDAKNSVSFRLGKNFKKFTVTPEKKTKINKISIKGAHGKKNYNLNKELSFSISTPPIRKIYFHRIFFPIICLLWIIWGIWYNTPCNKCPPSSEIYCIDFLRIIFSFVIVFCHIFNKYKWWNMGGLGCEFFFILAGFFMCYYNKDFNVLEWIKRNIAKFIPIMLFTFFIYLICHSNIPLSSVCSIFLFSIHVSDPGMYYLGIEWFICTLFWASLFYQCILHFFQTQKAYFLMGFIAFISYSIANAYAFLPHLSEYKLFPIALFRALASVGGGYFLGIFLKNRDKTNTEKQWKYTLLEVFFLIFVVFGLFIKDLGLFRNIWTVSLIYILVALFIIKKGYLSNLLNRTIFYYMARYALSLYLIHSVFVDIYYKLGPCWCIPLTLFCAVVSAVLIYHFIELPSYSYLRKNLKLSK